jgi:putative membrane protein
MDDMIPDDDHRPTMPRPEGRTRDHLANERTFLAWVRTALGLIGVGFVLARMGLFLEQLASVEVAGHRREFRGSHEFLATGIIFLLAGTALCAGSLRLYERARKGIELGRFEPARGAVLALTAVAVAGGLTITGLVLWQLLSLR